MLREFEAWAGGLGWVRAFVRMRPTHAIRLHEWGTRRYDCMNGALRACNFMYGALNLRGCPSAQVQPLVVRDAIFPIAHFHFERLRD